MDPDETAHMSRVVFPRSSAFQKLFVGLLSSLLQEIIEPVHEISNNVVCATSKGSDRPAHTRSLIRAFACRLNIL